MQDQYTTETQVLDRKIIFSRMFDASCETVFDVWTNSQHVNNWWGPKGFRTTTHDMDMRPGGTWRFIMHAPDGTDFKNVITFIAIDKPDRIAYRHGGEGDMEDVQFQTEVIFENIDGKTRLTMTMVFAAAEPMQRVIEKHGAIEGGQQHLGRLSDYVAALFTKMNGVDNTRDLVLTRVFDAPRAIVWKAWTEPEHIAKWLGPEGFSTRVEKQDFRNGGEYVYVMIGPDGSEYPSKGIFKDIVPIDKIVATDEFGDDFVPPPDMELPQGMITTTLFQDLGDKTKLIVHIQHPTATERIKHLKMGVIWGWQSTLDNLDRVVVSLK